MKLYLTALVFFVIGAIHQSDIGTVGGLIFLGLGMHADIVKPRR